MSDERSPDIIRGATFRRSSLGQNADHHVPPQSADPRISGPNCIVSRKLKARENAKRYRHRKAERLRFGKETIERLEDERISLVNENMNLRIHVAHQDGIEATLRA